MAHDLRHAIERARQRQFLNDIDQSMHAADPTSANRRSTCAIMRHHPHGSRRSPFSKVSANPAYAHANVLTHRPKSTYKLVNYALSDISARIAARFSQSVDEATTKAW
jgi:hypothetical protein